MIIIQIIIFGLLREPIRIVLFHPGLCVLHIIPAKQRAQNGVSKIFNQDRSPAFTYIYLHQIYLIF